MRDPDTPLKLRAYLGAHFDAMLDKIVDRAELHTLRRFAIELEESTVVRLDGHNKRKLR